jgi:hypothetical protein
MGCRGERGARAARRRTTSCEIDQRLVHEAALDVREGAVQLGVGLGPRRWQGEVTAR